MEVVVALGAVAVIVAVVYLVRKADANRPSNNPAPKAGSVRENANTAKK